MRLTMDIFKIEDVPDIVWDAVYEKWFAALRMGWMEILWTRCPLCDYMRLLGLGCRACPITVDKWCVNTKELSRLHRYYHDTGMGGYANWKSDVKEFLEFIEPFCSKPD
jgi:hypothetical protein